MIKNLPAAQKIQLQSLGWEDPLEKEMATRSSILAWRIPLTGEPGGLQSVICSSSSHWLHSQWGCKESDTTEQLLLFELIWGNWDLVQFTSVAQSCPTLWPDGLQHARPPCPSPNPGAYSNSCPLSRWCHPTISSSVILFSSHLQSFPASGSFPMSQFFTSGGQRIGVSASASVLPMNIQDWFPLGLTGLISL